MSSSGIKAWGISAVVAAGLAASAIYSEVRARPFEPEDRIKVTYWEKWSDFEANAMRAVVEKFNASQDKYFVEFLSVSGINNKTLMAASGGIPPDVAGLFGNNLAQYAVRGAILPLDEYIERDGVNRDDYIDVFWEMGHFEGSQYALPSVPASTALHVNTDHLAEIGLTVEDMPETIEEFDNIASQLVIKDENGRLKRSGFLPAEPGWWRDRFGYIFGGTLYDEEKGITTAYSPENVRAYEWAQGYAERQGYTNVQDFKGGFGSFNSPQNAFMDGKVSTVLQGVWMHNFIAKQQPDLNWAAVPFPHPADRPDAANSTYADLDILVIPKGAKQPDGAWEFIKFVQQQENSELLALGQMKFTPLKEVSDEFWEKHENPYVKLFHSLPQSDNAITPPKLSIWPEYNSEMTAAFDRISSGEDVAQALKDVDKRMQAKLERELTRRKLRSERGL